MNKTNSFKKLLSLSALSLAVFSNNVLADADIAVQPAGTATEATTNVDICVIVPEILIFGVGENSDVISKVLWTFNSADGTAVGNNQTYAGGAAPFTDPAPLGATPVASVTTGAAGSSVVGRTATLPVYLFSNNGTDVSITSAVSGGTGAGTANALDHSTLTNTIPITEFAFTEAGDITHPGPGSTEDTAVDANGIVNVADTWTYEYEPTSIPAAGTYEARITYTAAQP